MMPYDPPKSTVADIDVDEYRDPHFLAQWTVWLCYAQIALSLLAIISGLVERQVVNGLGAGTLDAGDPLVTASDERQRVVAILQLGFYVVGGVFGLMWIHRMCFNARIRARHMAFTPGWSVGWYFIPIATWWKPFQAMKEIWQTSVEQAGPRGREAEGLLAAWWTLWLVNMFSGQITARLQLKMDDLDSVLSANLFALIDDVVNIPLFVVFILMVQRLTAMQEYAHENPQAQAPDLRGFA